MSHEEGEEMWLAIRREAEVDGMKDPFMSEYYKSTILGHDSLESTLTSRLSHKLCDEHASKDGLYGVFLQAMTEDREIPLAVREDLRAIKDRDPAFVAYAHCFLHLKGFLACQAHRLAHSLYNSQRASLALLIQSRVSEVFGADIQPKAKIGRGIILDHATGIVIGETSVVGNGVTVYHDVTLGGNGKESGDRHPKIGHGVVLGAGSKVLGNIRIGNNAKIGAGSIVLKHVPDGATAVGNPARTIAARK